jgi:cathepsin A (carboxypeptidase C)
MLKYITALGLSVMAAPTEELIINLPNATLTTDSYSGYLPVTETKSLHYVYVESQGNVTSDPLLLWFNGGPGCSSLLGFFQENGPWVIDDFETSINENPYPWNLRANVLYLESPAGVGFSIANNDTDLV